MNEVVRTELLPGTTLCYGKYVIDEKIGSGGFGITYLAHHSSLNIRFAIKEFFLKGYNVRNQDTNSVSLLGIDASDFGKFRQRFINEAGTLAMLENEAIVKVLDIFDENGTSYMVMPFVQGTTLQSLVELAGAMNYEMAVNYVVQTCEALSYLHSRNILHRDVSPDNIIVTPEQKIVLIDFGSARRFVNNKTQRHTTIVKQGYAPLEQYSATSRKGAFTDLYSLGGVFYLLLTGQKPMEATERASSRMPEPIELNPQIPKQINAVIMKAMAMDASERYQSASELVDDILSGRMPEVKTQSEQHTIPKEPSRQTVPAPPKSNPVNETVTQIIEASDAEMRQPPVVSMHQTSTASIEQVSPQPQAQLGVLAKGKQGREDKQKKAKAKPQSSSRPLPPSQQTIVQPKPEHPATSRPTSKPTEDKRTQAKDSQLLQGNKLRYIVLSVVAGIIAILVIVAWVQSTKSVAEKTATQVVIEQTKTPSFDLRQLSQLSFDSIAAILNANPDNPIVLYAMAQRIDEDEANCDKEILQAFWDKYFIKSGYAANHLKIAEFSRSNFKFVCAARAYDILCSSNQNIQRNKTIINSLTDFMDRLIQLESDNFIYQRHV